MGWFQVTDVWAELSNGKKCFKFRFEKVSLAEKSWWAAQGTPELPAVRDFALRAPRIVCPACGKENPQVFEEGWMCLADDCAQFWRLNGTTAPTTLSYHPLFLRERSEWPNHIRPPYDLKPALLAGDMGNDPGYAVSRVNWKGMACPNCGRCNSREHWRAWLCKNCGLTHSVTHSVLSPRAVLGGHEVEYEGHALPQDLFIDPVSEQITFMDQWRVHKYGILPGNVVTHYLANSAINKRAGGPHDMFVALQGADMGLQRFPLLTSGRKFEEANKHYGKKH